MSHYFFHCFHGGAMKLRSILAEITELIRHTTSIILISMLILFLIEAYPAHAVDTGKLVEKDGQYVFVESMDPATRLLLERAYEKGIITQEERDKAIKDSETRAYLMQPSFKVWYDRGFNFSRSEERR